MEQGALELAYTSNRFISRNLYLLLCIFSQGHCVLQHFQDPRWSS